LIKDKLKEYIVKRNDKELWKWFAQYAESHQRLDDALNCYHHAEDFLSMVRVKCYQARNDPSPDVRASAMQAAEDLVDNSDNTAAAFFLATEYEALKQPRDAIRLFEKAGRHKHAVRIACANAPEFDKELLRIALQAPRRTMLDAAAYLEGKGEPALLDAAVTLLHKGGDSSQALQLCFTHRLFDSLRAIADDLGTDTDPQMLKRVGDFFLSNSQFDKAVHLFLSCKDPQQAIDLCERHRVKMTEDMAERLTELLPDKDKDEHGERVRTLVRIAELCMQQQEYHLATKKFTQAGEKARAMDALLKSGDTEKIIYFATVLRSKDIWIRAANYLQTQYGHERQPTYHQKIVEFYTKAKAYKPLAMFYDACAQMEMDDPRRPGESLSQKYQQALLLLKDSRKNLEKAQGDTMMLDRRIETVEKFVSFMSLIGSNVRADQEQGVALCRELLNSHQLEAAVHVGDVFAELIGFHYSVERNYEECYALIQQMQQRRLVVGQHLEPDVLEHIYHAKGIPLHRSQDVDGSIDEDVHEY
jgi:intraflagellar transport protein 140